LSVDNTDVNSREEKELNSFIYKIADEIYKKIINTHKKDIIEIKGLEDFKKIVSQGFSVITFYNPSCPVCKRFMPIYEEYVASRKYIDNYMKITFGKVNTREKNNLILSIMYQVYAVPTIIIFKDGEELTRHEGFLDLKELEEFISKHIKIKSDN